MNFEDAFPPVILPDQSQDAPGSEEAIPLSETDKAFVPEDALPEAIVPENATGSGLAMAHACPVAAPLEQSAALSAEDALQEEGSGCAAPVPAFIATLPVETPSEEQPRALGIRLRKAGQVYFFNDTRHTVRVGSKVLVELEQGPTLGAVESIIHGKTLPEPAGDSPEAKGTVVRLATAQDIAMHAENSILAAEANAFCRTCIRQRDLDMKLVDVEVLHDRSKIIFFFTAPSRIDFRELVKDLVRNYRTRIELRQIGVRHETQMIGGIGNCGMVCCCHKYLRKFAPVTIKMAKEQNLFLNPAKLSGMCGRLLCCLSFEQGNYEEFNRRCPKIGKRYQVKEKGVVKILRANMFSRSLVFLSSTGEEVELALEDWDALEPRRAEQAAGAEGRGSPRGPERDEDGGRRHRPRRNEQDDDTALSDIISLTNDEPGGGDTTQAGQRPGGGRSFMRQRKKRRL